MNAIWTRLEPPIRGRVSHERFLELARALSRVPRPDDDVGVIQELRDAFVDAAQSAARGDRQALLAAGLVLSDLATQGWQLRVRRDHVEVRPPMVVSRDRQSEKERIRRQELVKRDAQLESEAVRKFVSAMERPRLFDGRFTSIFSLIRDGRELADALRCARAHVNNGWAEALAKAIDPYLEFVSSDEVRCQFTGLRLVDIWRYFRHTWTNQYKTVPGRTMTFLVRDRAAPLHPIIGIGALSSPVMQIRERDIWVGWHPDIFLAHVHSNPTVKLARWLLNIVGTAIGEIYIDDLLEDKILVRRQLSLPDKEVIERLLAESVEQRKLHHRYVRSRDHKAASPEPGNAQHWVARARTHLFRSKRALALASYLNARMTLNECFGNRPTAESLAGLAATSTGSDVIRKILKKAKSDRVGIAVADISVCGAVQPYNAILGGKLVAMLTASPEVVLEYRHRYGNAESEIASSIAGRPIVRKPELVLLGTTSLYGVGSSQYNRIKIPCSRLGGSDDETIRYEEIGHSEAFGTSQYSEETVDALTDLVQQLTGGQRVNSIFGEGVSPKFRKIRQGLDLLNFPSGLLLRHHRRRVVYAVSLVRNLRAFMLALEQRPSFLVPIEQGTRATAQITSWWRERWLRSRISSEAVLEEVSRHTLVRPIQHGARVMVRATSDQQQSLFPDMT